MAVKPDGKKGGGIGKVLLRDYPAHFLSSLAETQPGLQSWRQDCHESDIVELLNGGWRFQAPFEVASCKACRIGFVRPK